MYWRHLRGILGRLGKIIGPSWAPKTPPRCAKISLNRPQEPPQRRLEGVPEASGRSIVTKNHPRAAQNPPDLDFGASRFGFWKCFSSIFARFLVDFMFEFEHFESSFPWQSACSAGGAAPPQTACLEAHTVAGTRLCHAENKHVRLPVKHHVISKALYNMQQL